MTFFPTIIIKNIDSNSPSIDAFGRLKVSSPFTQFDSKQLAGNPFEGINHVFKAITNGSSSFSQNRASSILSVTAQSGSRYIRQSRKRMNYQPGKGLSVAETFVFGTGSVGVVKRIGYFDDFNGVFLEQSGTNINMVLRSNVSGTPVDTRVSQSAWSDYKFDSSESLVAPFDPIKAQFFFMDFQWLGVGRVRTGFFQSGSFYLAHQFNNVGQTSVYMATPNLPVRTEIENYLNASANSIETICASVQSDAGFEPIGFQRSVDRVTGSKAVSAGVFKPVLSIKLTSGSQQTVIPKASSFFVTTADTYKWAILFNPTYSTTDAPVWLSIPSSSVMYDTARDGTIAGGVVIDSGYGGGTGAVRVAPDTSIVSNFSLGYSVDGVSDEIVLAVQPITTLNMLAQIGWSES